MSEKKSKELRSKAYKAFIQQGLDGLTFRQFYQRVKFNYKQAKRG